MEMDLPIGDGTCDVKLRLPGFAEKVLKLSLADSESRKETLDKAPPARVGNKRWGVGGNKTTSNPNPTKGNDDQPRIVD